MSYPAWRHLGRIWKFRRKRHILNFLAFMLYSFGGFLPAFAAKYVFDHIGPGSSLRWLVWPMALLAGRLVFGELGLLGCQLTNGSFAMANTALLQRNMLARVLQLPGGRALPSTPGEAITRFRDDPEVSWFWMGISDFWGYGLFSVFAFIVMLTIDVVVTLGVFTPLIAVVAIVQFMRPKIEAYRKSQLEATGDVTGFLADVLVSAQAVQVSDATDRVVGEFRRLSAQRQKSAIRDQLLEQLLHASWWVVNAGTGLVLMLAARGMRGGKISVGDLALFIFFLGYISGFTSIFGGMLAHYRQASVSFTRMEEVLAGSPPASLTESAEIYERGPLPEITTSEDAEPLDLLEVDGLTYRHPGSGRGIEDVSFNVPAGSFTVVTGRIGSGKSTLLHTLLGLLPADGGERRWNGTAVDDLLPPRAAFTPQVPQLFSDTLQDNIALGTQADVGAAISAAIMDEDLAEMPDGLETRIGPRGLRLSGGQLQRTAAARMLARNAQVLVCDDLSSALDVETEGRVWSRMISEGRTVLAVSHRRDALRRADNVVVMGDGRVLDAGPLDELLGRCDEMRRLWLMDSESAPV